MVLPARSAWLAGDVLAQPRALRHHGLVPPGGFTVAVLDPPWPCRSRGVKSAQPARRFGC